MDQHLSSPHTSSAQKQSDFTMPLGTQSHSTSSHIPPMNFQQIPPIHLNSSNSLNNNIQSHSQIPESNALLGHFNNANIGSDVDRKSADQIPLSGNVSRPHHYVLSSRSQYDDSPILSSNYSAFNMSHPQHFTSQQQNNAQYFPRLNEPSRPVSQGYTDAQFRQQVLMRPDPRQPQQQYSGYVASNMGQEPLNRSNSYSSNNLFSNNYQTSVYTPNSDSSSNYGSRSSVGTSNYGSQVSNYAPNRSRTSCSLPQNKIDSQNAPAKASDGSTETNFKPTQTKMNSRPKINKLESDYKYSSRSSPEGLEEHSHDKIYENFRSILGISTPRVDINKTCVIQLESPLEKNLFDLFCKDIAVFIDIFLTYDYFEKIVSEIAIYDDTRMMLDSLLCLSSLIFQRKYPQKIDPWCPLKYYQRSVYSIRHYLSLPEVNSLESGLLARCLISTNILCIYELFFIAIDSVYVKGAGSILMSILSKNTASKSLLKDSQFYQACFWATYVCDLVLSLKLELPNMFSTDIWKSLDSTYFSTFDVYPTEDSHSSKQIEDYSSYIVSKDRTIWWSNKIMLLCGEINDFSNSTDVITQKDYEMNTRYYAWLQLNSKLNEYVKHMPMFLKPLVHKPAQHESEFPTIYFDDERTAIIAINLNISKILLYFACQNLHMKDEALIEPEILKYPANYGENLAIDIAGIMQTYDSSLKVWPVSIHSLRQASKFIHPRSSCRHNMEKLVNKVIQVCQTRSQILTS